MVIRAFSIENVLNMKFSTIPLQSCPSCNNFYTFVVTYTWKIAPTFKFSNTGFKIFWWHRTSFFLTNFKFVQFCICSQETRTHPGYLWPTLSHGWYSFLWIYRWSNKLQDGYGCGLGGKLKIFDITTNMWKVIKVKFFLLVVQGLEAMVKLKFKPNEE